jgi:ribosomal protein S2
MEKRRKETRDWLREREQQLKDRINGPSIVRPRPEAVVVTDPKKKHIR